MAPVSEAQQRRGRLSNQRGKRRFTLCPLDGKGRVVRAASSYRGRRAP